MSGLDLLIRGGTVVGENGPVTGDVGVADGVVAAIGRGIDERAREVVDADGLHVFPGAVDAHVHLNEPGRTDWEGWATGTQALAAGGATTCVEMPFNAIPPTVSAADFDVKLAAASVASHVDFALWGGIVPGNRGELAGLADRGVAGFKAFMCETGLAEFRGIDELTLYEGMVEAAALGLPVLVHAESDAITAGLTARARAAGRTGANDYAGARPVVAELDAIARALALAEAAGCALHVVHVSSGRGAAMIAEARARGVDVSCETCPHYLTLTEADAEHLGTVAKCGPPLRDADEREALWSALASNRINMVVSDHSPALPELKDRDFLDAWGGIAGAQQTTELLIGDGHRDRKLPLERLADLLAGFAARRFSLRGKGTIALGADADLALVDLRDERTLGTSELLSRHRLSPYVGRALRCRVVRTVVRGTTVARGGKIVAEPHGRFVGPSGTKAGGGA